MTTFDPPICPECGAHRVRQHGECWLCGIDPVEFNQRGRAKSKGSGREFSFSLSSLLLIMTLLAICLGIVSEAPGLGVFICILLVPALMHTVQKVQHRKASGENVSVASKAGLLLGSVVLSGVLLAVIGVAAFGTLCGVCLTIVSVGGGEIRGLLPGMLLCGLGAGAIAILVYARRRFLN